MSYMKLLYASPSVVSNCGKPFVTGCLHKQDVPNYKLKNISYVYLKFIFMIGFSCPECSCSCCVCFTPALLYY